MKNPMGRAELLLKIVLSVVFAAAVLVSIVTFSLSEMVVSEELVIATEATPYPPELATMLVNIDSIVIKNVFWVSLGAIGFCLIFLYYLYGSFSIFLAPAILSLIVFIIFQIMLSILPNYLILDAETLIGPVLRQGLAKAQLANYTVLAMGALLFVVSLGALKQKK